MEFDANLTPKQQATMQLCKEPNARIVCWEGSVRSSKTIVSLLAWAQYIIEGPPGLLLMAGKTTETLRQNVLVPMQEIFGADNVKILMGAQRATILGREVALRGADNVGAISRIQGLTLAGAYVDELILAGGSNSSREWFDMLLTRLSIQGAKVFATTNPGPPTHWLLQDFLQKCEVEVTQDNRITRFSNAPTGLGVHRYRFTIDDNPTLAPDYVIGLRAKLRGLAYQRLVLGGWVAAEGAIFPSLDVDTVNKALDVDPLRFTRLTCGIDVGSTNPTHAVLTALDPRSKQMIVLAEKRLTGSGRTDLRQVEALHTWLSAEAKKWGWDVKRIDVVIDPAAKSFRNQWKLTARVIPKGANNAVLQGINLMGSVVESGHLVIIPGAAPHLVKELTGYAWDAKAQKNGVDKPLKESDHGVDALRYSAQHMRQALNTWLSSPIPEQARR